MKRLIAMLIACTTATAAMGQQGNYVAVPETKSPYGGVYIVNTTDGSVRHCYFVTGRGEVVCTPVAQ